ncbi:MAG: chemotaxis protein CheX [Magnetococcales bacterium]|nr:chemotaxis protein CheX [Magnetococcales bacterium]
MSVHSVPSPSRLSHLDLATVIRNAIDETIIAFFTSDIELKEGPAIITDESQVYQPPQADVTAIVGLSGTMEGGVHLSAPIHTALGLAMAFSGETLEVFDATARDALGELANIIAGAVKERISDAIYLTPPKVVTGVNLTVDYTKALASTKCYFRTMHGPFFVEVFYNV